MRRMKKIYQIISILLAVCLLTGIVGCRKKEQKADAKYTIYQINQSETALVPKDYDGTGKSVDDIRYGTRYCLSPSLLLISSYLWVKRS